MLLHHMYNALLDIYMKHESIKKICDPFNKRYGGDDTESK